MSGGTTHTVVRESPWVRRLWRSALALMGAALAAAPLFISAMRPGDGGPPQFVLTGHLLAAAGAAAGVASMVLRRWRPRWARAEEVHASDEGLRSAGEALVPRSAVKAATVTPRTTGIRAWLPRVVRARFPDGEEVYEVELAPESFFGHPIRMTCRTRDEARALVEALGLDARSRAVVRKVMSPALDPKVALVATFAPLPVALAGLVTGVTEHNPVLGALIAAPAVLAIIAFQVLSLIKAQVTIAADGASVRWLGRPTTMPLTEIARVEVQPRSTFTPARIVLHRSLGSPLTIAVGFRGHSWHEPFVVEEECARIVERIHEALAKAGDTEPTELRRWAHRRFGITPAAWIALLRGNEGAYREEPLPFTPSELEAVVTNVRASEIERASAAIALAAQRGDARRPWIADVARSTALPRLRAALEALARGDELTLLRVVTELRDAETDVRTVPPPPPVRVEVPAEPAIELVGEDDGGASEAPRDRLRRG